MMLTFKQKVEFEYQMFPVLSGTKTIVCKGSFSLCMFSLFMIPFRHTFKVVELFDALTVLKKADLTSVCFVCVRCCQISASNKPLFTKGSFFADEAFCCCYCSAVS